MKAKKVITVVILLMFALHINATKTSVCESDGTHSENHEYVDLGLPSGIKWATCNIGANAPEYCGAYYAWGSVEPYYASYDPLKWKEGVNSGYDEVNYKYGHGQFSIETLTKYNTQDKYGTVDNKTILEPKDDAASVNWGGNWRMPTKSECDELAQECTWTEYEKNGKKGLLATGPNGNTIFFPLSQVFIGTQLCDREYFEIWTSELKTSWSTTAYTLQGHTSGPHTFYFDRERGLPIRPVLSKSSSASNLAANQAQTQQQAQAEKYYKKGQEFYYLGHYKEAAAYLGQSLKIYDAFENAYAWYLLQYMFANNFYPGSNHFQEACTYLLPIIAERAKSGDAEAQFYLGVSYYTGYTGMVVENHKKASHWFRLSAEQGFAPAQYWIAKSLDESKYGNKELIDFVPNTNDGHININAGVLKFYQLAADQNFTPAMVELGQIYYHGKTANKDLNTSFQYFSKAAKMGNQEAECILGQMYYNGWGVDKNLEMAEKWARLAKEHGNPNAWRILDAIEKATKDEWDPEFTH